MKKKVWVASPICFVLAAAMLIMALISWFTGHKMVFFIEAVVAVVAILAIAIVHIRFQSYVYTSVKAAKKVLFGKEYDALEQFTMPMAIVGEAGDIVWANAAFLESAGRARDCRGENVMKFLVPAHHPAGGGGQRDGCDHRGPAVYCICVKDGAGAYPLLGGRHLL